MVHQNNLTSDYNHEILISPFLFLNFFKKPEIIYLFFYFLNDKIQAGSRNFSLLIP